MKKKQSFEEMLNELNDTVDQLSDEETPLEDALNLYAGAAEKIAACSAVLQDAKVRVAEITKTIAPQDEGAEDEV
ncbi:MAG: Exonuclease small subunit [Clostridiales bacterium]|jgi:exodeoxyribonuclease VII small subunit|nr:exodeoxyribonuclease VII small subunit [Pygmaiobacter sp.]MDK2813577.1 Exonuclease small subunit [Clostridiales bacterium]